MGTVVLPDIVPNTASDTENKDKTEDKEEEHITIVLVENAPEDNAQENQDLDKIRNASREETGVIYSEKDANEDENLDDVKDIIEEVATNNNLAFYYS